MSISELGSLGEFIASIVVVVTLLMLVFQIRQNTKTSRSLSISSGISLSHHKMKPFSETKLCETYY